MDKSFITLHYGNQEAQASWQGHGLHIGELFDTFMCNEVAARLHDEQGANEFVSYARGLALTGFGQDSLEEILAADVAEERDWAVGEAMAEAWLSYTYGVVWPWNMERDKRNIKASLPGADLVGFIQQGSEVQLVLGEVKTSAEKRYPPQVMSGRSGMTHQIDRLATNLGIINQLLMWLWFRCKNTDFESQFNASVTLYFNSGNKAVSLFGVLIRDTEANELDLKAHGEALAGSISAPTSCVLVALYLPCKISDLPKKVAGGEAS